MSYKKLLQNPQHAEVVWRDISPKVKAYLMGGNRLELVIKKEKRSLDQNAKLWATLGEIANQVDWYGQKLTAEDWKTMLTATLRKQRTVPGVDGGFVVLGLSTSKMSKEEMSELLELALAFGAQKGVVFHE